MNEGGRQADYLSKFAFENPFNRGVKGSVKCELQTKIWNLVN